MALLKNLFVGVVCILIIGFGYYFLTNSVTDFTLDGVAVNADDLVARTEVFIERRTTLE